VPFKKWATRPSAAAAFFAPRTTIYDASTRSFLLRVVLKGDMLIASTGKAKVLRASVRSLFGRILMSLGTAIAGFIPLVVDLTPTHVLNPAWPAHARLHEVWLLATGGLLALVALYFIWCYRERPQLGIALAGVLIGVLLGGFFIASATASLYGGILVDPVTAPMMPNQDLMMGIPLNSVVFGLAFLLLLTGFALAKGASPSAPLRETAP
jgi:hypothetical protein